MSFSDAIQCYERASIYYTRETNPQRWAAIQRRLGLCWLRRGDGEVRRNLEISERHFQWALEIYGEDEHSADYSHLQNDLGNVYLLRASITDRAKNLVRAKGYFAKSINSRSKDTVPTNWARAALNYALVNAEIADDNPVKSLRDAIALTREAEAIFVDSGSYDDLCAAEGNIGFFLYRLAEEHGQATYEQSVSELTKALSRADIVGSPLAWARAASNLAGAKANLPNSTLDDLHAAIDLAESAQAVISKERDSNVWGRLTINLAAVLARLASHENPSKNLLTAYQLLNDALDALKDHGHPLVIALSQLNVALIALQLQRLDSVQQGLHLLEESSKFFTREHFPQLWARCKSTEALLRAHIKQPDNYAKAIRLLTESLEVFNKEVQPIRWAAVHKERGNAKLGLAKTAIIVVDLESAWNDFLLAGSIYTQDSFPREWAEIQNNLATIELLQDDTMKWRSATQRLEPALSIAERLEDWYMALIQASNLKLAWQKLADAYGDQYSSHQMLFYHLKVQAITQQMERSSQD